MFMVFLVGCLTDPPRTDRTVPAGTDRAVANPDRAAPAATDGSEADRHSMVLHQLRNRDITDEKVLAAMEKVPRHRFVPMALRPLAYDDGPLPIGHQQTISQPYIVAYMTEALEMKPGAKVLEIGTGSGYQAAVLAEIAREVFTIEIVPELAKSAEEILRTLGYGNIHVRAGDGYKGWPAKAPFDAIIVTAAPDHIPQPLIDQLAPGGTLVIPVGTANQEMMIVTRTATGVVSRRTIGVRFVPMTGEAQEDRQ